MIAFKSIGSDINPVSLSDSQKELETPSGLGDGFKPTHVNPVSLTTKSLHWEIKTTTIYPKDQRKPN